MIVRSIPFVANGELTRLSIEVESDPDGKIKTYLDMVVRVMCSDATADVRREHDLEARMLS